MKIARLLFHATDPENVPSIMKDGLKAPVYMMNGLGTIEAIERGIAKQTDYKGGNQVLLQIRLPNDWPLFRDEASETDQYVKSLKSIPSKYIEIHNRRWP